MLEMSDSDSDYVDIGEADETLGDGATDEVETLLLVQARVVEKILSGWKLLDIWTRLPMRHLPFIWI